MKIISFNDIIKMGISPRECYQWVEESLSIKQAALLPAKISLKPSDGIFYNTMPVLIPSEKRGGVKIVSRYPERIPSLQAQILLYDLESGENLALMNGTWITTMRTGAVAAHSIKLFAVEGFSQLGFIGLGNTARATLLILLSIYPQKALKIKLKKYKSQHLDFAKRFEGYNNIEFEFCDSYEDVVSGSDVVVSAVTYFDEDICPNECFKEGVCLVPVHTRGFTNCDLFFDKVFADDINHVHNFKNFAKFKSFAEVSEVITGQKPGRENNKERILAYNIGIALHDIFFAGRIYEMCENHCESISLTDPSDKFWV